LRVLLISLGLLMRFRSGSITWTTGISVIKRGRRELTPDRTRRKDSDVIPYDAGAVLLTEGMSARGHLLYADVL